MSGIALPLILAVANQKGGVAKTTTSINLATGLATQGYRTLLVDCDPQANATSGLGIAREPRQKSTYDVLCGNTGIAEAALQSRIKNLHVVPSSRNLIGANVELVHAEQREYQLRNALEAASGSFDFAILDCPPALDLLTLNALTAADLLLVPMQAEYFALEGVSELLHTVERIRSALNPKLVLDAVLLTMFDERTNLAQQVADNLRGYFGAKLLQTVIPRNIRLAEAPSHGMPVSLYDPKSRGAEAYRDLVKELLTRWELTSPVEEQEKAEAARTQTTGPHSAAEATTTQPVEGKKVRFWPYG